jgi:hypothetical protein
MRQACLRGHVSEGAVSVVVEQVAGWCGARLEATRVDEKNVEPPVVVVVEEGGAAAHLLEQELLVRGMTRHVLRIHQTGGGGDVCEQHRRILLAGDRHRPPRETRAEGRDAAQESPARPQTQVPVQADVQIPTSHADRSPPEARRLPYRGAFCRARSFLDPTA